VDIGTCALIDDAVDLGADLVRVEASPSISEPHTVGEIAARTSALGVCCESLYGDITSLESPSADDHQDKARQDKHHRVAELEPIAEGQATRGSLPLGDRHEGRAPA
jgi:hypothetical protein